MKIIIKLIIIINLLAHVAYANLMVNESDIHIYEGSKIQKKDARKIIEYISNSNNEVLYKGQSVNFYKIDKYGISKTKKDYKTQEFYNLKYLNYKNIKNIPRTYGLFKYKEDYYIISDYFKGNYWHVNGMSSSQLKKILKTLLELDKIFLYHSDLNGYNILFSENRNNINIIDFDQVYFIDSIGQVQSLIEFNSPCTNKRKCLYDKINSETDKTDILNPYADNVFLHIPSNINSFEYRFLSSIYDNEKFRPLFCEYLLEKSNYIRKRHRFYSKILLLSKNKTDNINAFKYALKIDKSISETLKKGNSNVIEIEKLKLEIKQKSFHYKFDEITENTKYKQDMKELFAKLRDKIENVNTDDKDLELYLYSVKNWIEVWEPISLDL